jgi:uncharacterized membrane protein
MPRHPRWVRRFLSETDLHAVAAAIAAAEKQTSAEVRVHLDAHCPGDAMAQAVSVFERLGMHRTAERHGVLIYVAIEDRKLAVLGDQGIHDRLGQTYWDRLVQDILAHFRDERPRDGLLHAVGEVGAALRQHFPRRSDDDNELPDQLSIGPDRV